MHKSILRRNTLNFFRVTGRENHANRNHTAIRATLIAINAYGLFSLRNEMIAGTWKIDQMLVKIAEPLLNELFDDETHVALEHKSSCRPLSCSLIRSNTPTTHILSLILLTSSEDGNTQT